MRDIGLADAVIAANIGKEHGGQFGPQALRVLTDKDLSARHYDMTWGACESRWNSYPKHRIAMLYEIIWVLVLGFKFDAEMIHRGLSVIPEYRDLNGDGRLAA